MVDVNTLELCRDDYDSKEEFENAIKTAILLLIEANYIATIEYDEKHLGIIRINYNYKEQSFGCKYPYWLTPEEFESIIWDYERNEVE